MFATSEDAMDSLYVVDGFLVSTRCKAGCKSDIDGSSLTQKVLLLFAVYGNGGYGFVPQPSLFVQSGLVCGETRTDGKY
ncbi:hypothetical protein MTO96_011374 [Rhipicephalus appendiculatus]